MDLYLENGYCNVAAIIQRGMTFNFVIGGRGTGKTYGALKYVLENHVTFAIMRRTQAQLDTIARAETNPFKSIVRDMGVEWVCEPDSVGKSIYGYYRKRINEDGTATAEELLGYGIALSTVANLRGFDLSDIDIIIYDEFIPEVHERAIKGESDAFFNAYETINRNRELQGKKPIQVLALANANDFACPLLIGLNLVSTVEKMIRAGKTDYVSPQKSVGIFLLTDSPISGEKAATALYKLTVGTAFSDMAINNAFEGSHDPDVYPVNLLEYNPVVAVGELCAYRHKSTALYYISAHTSGSVGQYSGDGVDMKRFMATHKNLIMAVITGKCIYESHLVKALFLRYCGFN
jgi:hypothetical protein